MNVSGALTVSAPWSVISDRYFDIHNMHSSLPRSAIYVTIKRLLRAQAKKYLRAANRTRKQLVNAANSRSAEPTDY